MADHFQKRFGDILYTITEAENYSGKAFAYRPNETVKMWLRRGSREGGENREKFRKTIFSQTRITMKKYANDGVFDIFQIPEPGKLAAAFESVKARAVELTKEANLDAHSAELVLGAIQAAYATMTYGPNMADLAAHRLMALMAGGMPMADASSEATRWTQDEIVKARIAPNNPYGDDEEAIAAAILQKILSEEK